MIDLGEIKAKISVDDSDAVSKLKGVGDKSQSLASKMGSSFATAGKAVAGATMAIGGAVVAGGTALYGMATKAAETTDRIDKLSQKIGMSRETFQEWDFICSQSGMSVEQLQGGFKTLTASIDKVAAGNKDAIANFERLGVSVTDSSGKLKSQEQVFEECVTALQSMEDGTEKARLATEIFGKSGSELMPLLNGAAGSVEAMKNQAHELGLVMSDEAIDAGVAFTDQMDQLKRSFGAVVANIGADVIPIISELCASFLKYMPQIQAIMSKVFDVISVCVDTVIKGFKLVIDWVKDITKASQEEGTKQNEIWTKIKTMFANFFAAVKEFVSTFVKVFQQIWEKWGATITRYAEGLFKAICIIFETVFKTVTNLLNVFSKLFQGDWKGLWEAVKKLVGDLLEGIVKFIKNSFDTIVDIAKDIIPRMKEAGKNIFNGLWDGIKGVWKNISSWVNEKVSWLVDKLKFWDKGTEQMNSDGSSTTQSVDGSHRTGLSYVPFDNYLASLHQGEMVLTSAEANAYRNMGASEGLTVRGNLIELTVNGTPDEAILRALKQETENIAKFTINKINTAMINRGMNRRVSALSI